MINIKHLIFFFIIVFGWNLSINTQDKQSVQRVHKIASAEKIYVQLNSTVFTSDQTIWFKAIVTNVNQKPTVLSNILHIDLINFDEKIITSKLLKLENGIGNGFFDLTEFTPLPVGKYMIRAYTKWNANFNENLANEQYINIYKPTRSNIINEPIRNVVITEQQNKKLELSAKIYPKLINPKFKGELKIHVTIDDKKDVIIVQKDKNDEYLFKYMLPEKAVKATINVQLDSIRIKNLNYKRFRSFSKSIAIDKEFLDVQFFPEGGKLIDGLKSTIGFKALDYKNEGIAVTGSIEDENGTKITEFKSNDLGMGMFQFQPNFKKNYFALVLSKENKVTYRFKLPEIAEKGYGLTIKTHLDFFRLQLSSNFSKNDSISVKVKARGLTYYHFKAKCKDGKIKMSFKRDLFPEGIVTFTFFDNNNIPICERLVFNYKEENERLKITTKSNKETYKQRDKVVLDVNINNLKSNANTSCLVINKRQLGKMHLERSNILSYFLLESELKGTIEQPQFYFDTNNKERFYAMDALLLTQGWRNYILKTNNDNSLFEYKPEKNLQISGTIDEYANRKRKRKKPIELTLMTLDKKNLQASVTTMDSSGRFSFNIKDSYTKNLEYLIQTKNHKGRKKALTITVDKPKPLQINFKKEEKIQLADDFKIYINENIKRYAKENPFTVDENGYTLDEVVVKTRLLSPIQKQITDEHGEPDVIIEDKELLSKVKKWSYGLFSILLFNYTNDIDVKIINDREFGSFLYAHVYGSRFTFAIVDGTPVKYRDYPLLETIATQVVKSVEIIKYPKNKLKYFEEVFGYYFPGGPPDFAFLNIYTHKGEGLFSITETKGLYKKALPSFSLSKEFYAPKHENLTKSDWEIPDLRSTVFWNPKVKTDKNGNAKVEFYADDNSGEMMVIIESSNDDGKLGYYQTSYRVNKK